MRRTKAELLALFQDNTSGDITPENVRDFVESTELEAGGFYWPSPAVTNITGSDTPVKAAGPTTPLLDSTGNISVEDNRISYFSSESTATMVVLAALSVSATNNDVITTAIYKNDILIPGSVMTSRMESANYLGNPAIFCAVDMEDGDYIEVWYSNSANQDVTTENGMVIAFSRFQ